MNFANRILAHNLICGLGQIMFFKESWIISSSYLLDQILFIFLSHET